MAGAQPAPQLHSARSAVPGLGKLWQKVAVSRHAATFLWKLWELLLVCGRACLPPPLWMQALNGQQAPRPRPPANSNRLLAEPRSGASVGRAQGGWLRQDAPGHVPWRPPASTPWGTFPPQKYNADYDLSARQGADTLAFMSLLEEKLLPVLVSVPGPAEFVASEGGAPAPHMAPLACNSMGIRSPPQVGHVHGLRPASPFPCLRSRYIRFGWTPRTTWK